VLELPRYDQGEAFAAVLSVGWQLVSDWRDFGRTVDPSGHEILPLRQGGGAASLVCLTIDEMAFGVEMIVQAGVN